MVYKWIEMDVKQQEKIWLVYHCFIDIAAVVCLKCFLHVAIGSPHSECYQQIDT